MVIPTAGLRGHVSPPSHHTPAVRGCWVTSCFRDFAFISWSPLLPSLGLLLSFKPQSSISHERNHSPSKIDLSFCLLSPWNKSNSLCNFHCLSLTPPLPWECEHYECGHLFSGPFTFAALMLSVLAAFHKYLMHTCGMNKWVSEWMNVPTGQLGIPILGSEGNCVGVCLIYSQALIRISSKRCQLVDCGIEGACGFVEVVWLASHSVLKAS